ncbi:MAG: hypothetical protein HQ518_32340 [Rhodopirellula sp.]|nr:hypothetical protein [Rhodopirellula sp.]
MKYGVCVAILIVLSGFTPSISTAADPLATARMLERLDEWQQGCRKENRLRAVHAGGH